MLKFEHKKICVIGCGVSFDSIESDYSAYAPSEIAWQFRRVDNVAELSSCAHNLLQDLDKAETMVFVAVDGNALNYARLELFGPAKLRGFKMPNLIHDSAVVSSSVKMGDNIWIGPMVAIAHNSSIGSNVMINTGVRVDSNVKLGSHLWIGPGASIENGCAIGNYSILSSNVQISSGLQIGAYCFINSSTKLIKKLANGSFIEPGFGSGAMLIGRGYSWYERV